MAKVAARFFQGHQDFVSGLERDDGYGLAVRTGEADSFGVLQNGSNLPPTGLSVDQHQGAAFHLNPAHHRGTGAPLVINHQDFVPGRKFPQIPGFIPGNPDIGVYGAGVDPEGAGGDVRVFQGFGVNQEEAGVPWIFSGKKKSWPISCT